MASTHANEQADEIEKIEGRVQELKNEEERYAQECGNDAQQYERVLEELNDKIEVSEAQADKLDQKCEESQKTINGLKSGIQVSSIQIPTFIIF